MYVAHLPASFRSLLTAPLLIRIHLHPGESRVDAINDDQVTILTDQSGSDLFDLYVGVFNDHPRTGRTAKGVENPNIFAEAMLIRYIAQFSTSCRLKRIQLEAASRSQKSRVYHSPASQECQYIETS
ncbi:hypothetical protein BDW60DRAFT_212811 [Aspergillus nidulans var. acristatus]